MISFDNVAVRYPRASVRALDSVSLVAERRQVTAVTGPNGSGKSTLVRALLRRPPAEAGRITVDGDELLRLPPVEVARRVAVVPQREEPAFPLRVDEYIALGRYPRLGLWQSGTTTDTRAVARGVERADVEGLLGRRTDELSGGEWQRVRIARALVQEGKSLVLDEPTTFLDLGHEMALFELLGSLAAEGMAVLIVSHQLNLVARFADTVVLLNKGRVVAAGTAAEVMQAKILEPVYEWPLVVTNDPAAGAPSLIPLRRKSSLF